MKMTIYFDEMKEVNFFCTNRSNIIDRIKQEVKQEMKYDVKYILFIGVDPEDNIILTTDNDINISISYNSAIYKEFDKISLYDFKYDTMLKFAEYLSKKYDDYSYDYFVQNTNKNDVWFMEIDRKNNLITLSVNYKNPEVWDLSKDFIDWRFKK